MSDGHANYLRDLGQLIHEEAQKAKNSATSAGDAFASGRAMAYFEVLSLMEQQAVAFDLSLTDLGLDGFDAHAICFNRPR